STAMGARRLSPQRPSRLQTTVAATDSSSRFNVSVEPASGNAGPSIIAPAWERLRIRTGADTVPAAIEAASMTFLRGARGVRPGRDSADMLDDSSTLVPQGHFLAVPRIARDCRARPLRVRSD